MLRTTRRIIVTGLLAGATLAGVAPGAEAQSAGLVLRPGQNQRIGAETAPVLRTAEAPGLAVNPADPRHLVESHVNPRYGQCEYNVSFDGGQSWSGGTLRAPAKFGVNACTGFNTVNRLRMDGGIAFGSGMNVYIAFDARTPDLGEGSTTMVARSTDGGRTFAEAQVVISGGPGVDAGFGNLPGQMPSFVRPKLGVLRRPSGDRVVVASLGIMFNSRHVAVSVSNDSGATWSASVEAQPAGETAAYVSNPVLTPDGTIYVSWQTQHSTALGFAADADEFNWISRSSDSGATWTSATIAKLGLENKASRVNEQRLALDPRDGRTLYQVDNETIAANDPDIFVQRSTDGGATWSPRVRVNDDPTTVATQQTIPNISVAANGRIDVVWSDRRLAYGTAASHEIFMASSTDGGLTFSANRRLTDRTLSGTNGPTTLRSTDFFVPAIVPVGGDEVLVAWSDPRETTFDSENNDIYASRVRVNPTTPPPATRLALAQPAGLSVSLARLAYPGGAEKHVAGSTAPATRVVVVNEGDVGAALAGGVLARANLGPVLASPAAGLPPDVAAEIRRIGPFEVIVVGDESAMGAGVGRDILAAGVPAERIVRIAGANPADTARRVAEAFAAIEVQATPARTVPRIAVVVDPASREAASAGALAAGLRYPVLFATRDSLPAETAAAIAALGVTATLVIGGPGTIGDGVLLQLPNATRVGGADAYGTARAVAAEAVARGLAANIAYVVDGERPIDGALAGAAVARVGGALVMAPGADPSAASGGVDRVVVVRSTSEVGPGYRLVSSDGGVFAFGGARFLGSTVSLRTAKPVVGMASVPGGYWLVAADGGVFAFGDAEFHGSTGALKLNAPIVGMAATPTGLGYWLVAADGGVFAFGDAVFRGSTGALKLNRPIVGLAASPSGRGYHLVAADGGVFAFGDAVFRGSTGALKLSQPIVGLTRAGTSGYYLMAADGGVFAFGVPFLGAASGGPRLASPIVGAA